MKRSMEAQLFGVAEWPGWASFDHVAHGAESWVTGPDAVIYVVILTDAFEGEG